MLANVNMLLFKHTHFNKSHTGRLTIQRSKVIRDHLVSANNSVPHFVASCLFQLLCVFKMFLHLHHCKTYQCQIGNRKFGINITLVLVKQHQTLLCHIG